MYRKTSEYGTVVYRHKTEGASLAAYSNQINCMYNTVFLSHHSRCWSRSCFAATSAWCKFPTAIDTRCTPPERHTCLSVLQIRQTRHLSSVHLWFPIWRQTLPAGKISVWVTVCNKHNHSINSNQLTHISVFIKNTLKVYLKFLLPRHVSDRIGIHPQEANIRS